MKLSIIIPVYNEINTIIKIIDKILDQKNILKEIIVVDDGSKDGTKELIENELIDKIDTFVAHHRNRGKGAAIRTGLSKVSGQIILIQDADLEYDPSDYPILIKPIIDKKFSVVYGSRVLGKKRYNFNGFTSIFRVFANHALTVFSNIINFQKLTDAHTCYKVFNKNILESVNLNEDGFNFCPELTTKLSNNKIKIFEVPIKYHGRGYGEGKKIQFSDGIQAFYTILKYKFFK